jgi:aminomethyltransferase
MLEFAAQYRAVREAVGLLDRSEVGKLAILGPDRFTWLQGMVSNDVRLLEKGARRLQACVLNATGHLLSDLTLVNVTGDSPLAAALDTAGPDFVLAELPRANVEKIVAVFDRLLIMEDVEIRDVSAELGCLSLQGPDAAACLSSWQAQQTTLWKLIAASFYAVEADHTGSGGLDLYCTREAVEALREAILLRGVPEIGQEAQEALRVEAGLPQYGVDMDESVIALEANLGPTHISLTKGCYVGQEIIARIDSRGHTNRALTGLILASAPLPAPGEKLFSFPTDAEPVPREVGRLTSIIAAAPAVGGRPIALGYVRHEQRASGIRLRMGETAPERIVEVVELPFYRGNPA